jgi:hypothetical protein
MSRRFKLIVFAVALVTAALFHLLNHFYLDRDNPDALRNGVTVLTSDDASYLAPVENFLEGEGWKSNAVGKAAYTTRSPGYGLFYLAFRLLLNEKSALIALVIFQILLFAYSLTLVPGILNSLLLNKKWKQVLTLSFACLPMFFGFLSYTLTEAVTPSLVIIAIALFVKQKKSEKDHFLLWSLLGFIILIRPPLIVWALAIPVLYFPFKGKNVRRLLAGSFVVFVPTLIWQIHLYNVTNDIQGLHPIYQDDSNTIYRPTHQAIWNFHKSWGQSGPEFHKSIDFLASAARYNRKKEDAVLKVIQKIPGRVKSRVSVDALSAYYGQYFDILQSQAHDFKNERPIPGLSKKEKALIKSFEKTTKQYSRSDFFYSQLVVPAQVFKRLALHSNLSLYVFQKPWRGNLFMEALRIICFANHFLAFYVFLISIFILFPNKNALLIIIPTATYLAYLCFVQRGVEERYTLPFLIPMVAISAKTLELLYRRSIHLIKGQ